MNLTEIWNILTFTALFLLLIGSILFGIAKKEDSPSCSSAASIVFIISTILSLSAMMIDQKVKSQDIQETISQKYENDAIVFCDESDNSSGYFICDGKILQYKVENDEFTITDGTDTGKIHLKQSEDK